MQFKKNAVAAALALCGTPIAALAAPTVSWVSPASGAKLYGVYSDSPACEVTSNARRVKFYVDSQEVYTDSTAPWRCSFDSRRYSAGTHTLKATAIAADGSATTVTRSVTFATSAAGTVSPTSTPTTTTTTTTAGPGTGPAPGTVN